MEGAESGRVQGRGLGLAGWGRKGRWEREDEKEDRERGRRLRAGRRGERQAKVEGKE